MELKTCTEQICISDTIYNGVVEQSVELDYMLPDYCPNIFKVLKTTITTKIMAQNIVGTKLTIDGVAFIKIIYVSEDTGKLRQLEQKQAFTKSVDLKEDGDGLIACICPKTDYVNCRAVNSKRLDIRGAISMRITVRKAKEKAILSDCSQLQMHKQTKTFCEKQKRIQKDFSLKEEMQIGSGNQPIQDIIHYDATAVVTEYKLLANKVICKGEVLLHTLYLCSQTPDKPEVLEHTIPISQIIDFEGIDEDYTCCTTLDVMKHDIDMQIDDDGECRTFTAQITLRATCEAARNHSVEVVDDCYSTAYETTAQTEQLKVEHLMQLVWENSIVKNTVSLNQNEIGNIYDILHEVANTSWHLTDEKIYASCELKLSVLALSEENIPICVEKVIPCEVLCAESVNGEDFSFYPTMQVTSLGFHIASLEEIEVRAEVKVRGNLYSVTPIYAMTEVDVCEDKPKKRDNDCALRLYFADSGESVWEIAKRYNTSVGAILEQNAIESESIADREMIFIPIVD